ncbi:MAG: hypothetical protein BWY17_02237 [Deltaproteobacteria bacterium ADurb.Bin207]|jgi:hypothetical protein|nr:MAG: hypothetical protein BWY17_02237 [Deltaproteobacteria bacterium ADurb.Bin207]
MLSLQGGRPYQVQDEIFFGCRLHLSRDVLRARGCATDFYDSIGFYGHLTHTSRGSHGLATGEWALGCIRVPMHDGLVHADEKGGDYSTFSRRVWWHGTGAGIAPITVVFARNNGCCGGHRIDVRLGCRACVGL